MSVSELEIDLTPGIGTAMLGLPPAGSGPGLLLLAEAAASAARQHDLARDYAAEGYVCLALATPPALPADTLEALLTVLRAQPARRGKLGVIGFETGAALACRLAATGAVDCAVAYDPGAAAEVVAAIRAALVPLLVQLGDTPAAGVADLASPPAGNASRARIQVHAGQRPAFANPDAPTHDRAAARLAHSRTLALLREVLGPIYDLSSLWDAHTACEFATRDVDATMATMVAEPYVNHIPTMTGGVGYEYLKRFYKYHFVHANPPDTRLIPVSRTVGTDRVVDEMVFCFTHSCEIPWMLPGIAPTGRYVEIPLVAIVNFRGDKLYHEHIYWDQASVLVQIGLLDPDGLPVAGIATARKLLDETLPSNELMGAAWTASAGRPL